MNTYEETVDWIHHFITLGEKPGLKRMEWLLEKLGHPETKVKFVHVGGTNGKGSTVSFLRHVLSEAGVNVGTFTSPFIERFNERISFNGEPIADTDLVQVAKLVRPYVEELSTTKLGSPTTFEVITTMALVYFAKVVSPDIVILEVGIGGQNDSTNVITPLVSLITNVGFDHMNMLGNTIEEIALHKAGIIKPRVPVITTAEREEVLRVFCTVAKNMQAPIYQIGKDFRYHKEDSGHTFRISSTLSNEKTYTIKMQGEHQIRNASLAVMAIQILNQYSGFNIDDVAIKKGLLETIWIGRFEIIQEKPLIIIDGAHNKEGFEALAQTLQENYSHKNIHLIFAATKEKEVETLLAPLYKSVNEICFTTFDSPRAAQATDLYEHSTFSKKIQDEAWDRVIMERLQNMKSEDILLITGSLYFISEIRNWFLSDRKRSS